MAMRLDCVDLCSGATNVVEEADAGGDIDDLLDARGGSAVEVEVDVDLGLACCSGYRGFSGGHGMVKSKSRLGYFSILSMNKLFAR